MLQNDICRADAVRHMSVDADTWTQIARTATDTVQRTA